MYIKEKLRKLCLLLGFIGTALFAVGDVLLQNFENSGETFLYMIKPTIADQPMWQLYFVLLTGAIATPFMWLGLSAMHSHIKDRLNGNKSKMLTCYDIAAVTGSLTFFAAHSVCAVLMMSVKNALECGVTPERIDAVYDTSFLLSFAAANVWVTITETMLSVAFIYFVFEGIIAVPKVTCVMNTVGAYIIFHLAGCALTGATGNGIFLQLAGLGASLGIGLMFIAVCFAKDSR
ncbi:MAG: hypothetical protein II820_07480 [Ruminiclostridium sp.]|nr:hypothetical protein [Ruminiclostridium sp.]